MKPLVALGMTSLVIIELLALSLRQRGLLLAASGIAVALLVLGFRRIMERESQPEPEEQQPDDGKDWLHTWMSSTESRIRWAEATRKDWDRRWRPILASRFEMTTGQRQAKSPPAYAATGRVLFGSNLWKWVDPSNVAPTGSDEAGGPGPGRAALEEILQRLEQQ